MSDLRERLARALFDNAVNGPIAYGMDACRSDADAVLAALDEAGYVVLDQARWERVRVEHERLWTLIRVRERLELCEMRGGDCGDLVRAHWEARQAIYDPLEPGDLEDV
jgi:hypothetical protein